MMIKNLPKAELHVHLIGTMQPEMLMRFAQRNNVPLPWASQEEMEKAFRSFHDLASFLHLYFLTTQVIKTELDFYELLYAYMQTAHEQGVIHLEIFFEVQTFIPQEVSFSMIMQGLNRAREDAYKAFGISCLFILCFLREETEDEALQLLEQSLAYKDSIIGIGLASHEKDNPPAKFARLYKQAKAYGYKCTIHAGEDAGPDYIWQALELGVDRIDHGVACMQDANLIQHLAKIKMPLTVCPLSNVKLNVVTSIEQHPIGRMLEHGLLVSINSDDPAFFGSLNENYEAIKENLGISNDEFIELAKNSFASSFVSEEKKKEFEKLLDIYVCSTI